jgi:hypothetical protein
MWKGAVERAILEKTDYEEEFRFVFPGGIVRWIYTAGHPVLTAAGALVQFIGSSTDITSANAPRRSEKGCTSWRPISRTSTGST